MFDRIGATHDYIASGLSAENVNSYGAICVVGFGRCGANFLLGVIIRAGVVGDELDEVRAVENIFANGFANFFGAVGVDVFVAPDWSDFRGDMFSLSAEGSDNFSGGENRGAGEPSSVNCVADINGSVFGFISDVANGGDAGVEKNLRGLQTEEDAGAFALDEVVGFERVLEIVFEEGNVGVSIHHAGHEPFVREVNHLRVGGDGDAGTYLGDFLVFYQDDLVGGNFSCGGIDDVAGADGDGLSPDRKCEEDCDQSSD